MLARLIPITCALGGCFSSWAITQASGGQAILDEGVREQHVPLPEVHERLNVRMPLVVEMDYPPGPASPSPNTGTPRPFELHCEAKQNARDTVYHLAFRYGKTWKKVALTMFLIEGAVAAATYYGADQTKPGNQIITGYFAVDALGTAALLFAPRKEVFGSEQVPLTTHVRSDCPDGLALAIGAETFPVDAAGHIGELGLAALDGWMQRPAGAIGVTYAGQTIDMHLGLGEQCTWNRAHHPEQPACASYLPSREVFASMEVPMGTLTRME